MKTSVLQFTCLKLHYNGESFAPQNVSGNFELQSVNSVLVGSLGNSFKFKSEDSANTWLDSNLIRASKQPITDESFIDNLIVKNSIEPHDYLQTEINTLNAKNAGDWFYDLDLFIDGGNSAG